MTLPRLVLLGHLVVLMMSGCGRTAHDPALPPIREIVQGAPEPVDARAKKETQMAEAKVELSGALDIVPGRSIGPIALDMQLTQLRAAPFAFVEGRTDDSGYQISRAGPIRVVLKDERVISLELELGAPGASYTVSGKPISQVHSLEKLAELFPDCEHVEHGEGGRMMRCAGGSMLLKLGSVEHARIAIEVAKP
jgi:hypothetical protein